DFRAGLVLRKAIQRSLVFAGGAVTPLVITFLTLWYAGVFAKFWFWTIHYAHEYGTLVSISEAPHIFIQSVREAIGPNWSLWIVAGVGLLTCPLNRLTGTSTGFLLGLFISPIEASHKIYAGNPFPETIKVAEYVREHTDSADTIAVGGSEPQIYFYSHRHSATGYIYTYPLMEPQKYARPMQSEMIHEIGSAQPKYLISITIDTSWLHSPRSENLIFEWAQRYIADNHIPVGFVNIIAPDRVE